MREEILRLLEKNSRIDKNIRMILGDLYEKRHCKASDYSI